MRNYTDKCPKCGDPVSVCFCEKEPPSDPQREGSETPEWSAMRNQLDEVIRDETSDTYVCGRVWSSWGYGTMSEDDFTRFDKNDRIENLVYSIEEIVENRMESLRNKLTAAREALERIANDPHDSQRRAEDALAEIETINPPERP